MEYRFKYLREKIDLKQHEIAKLIDISRSNYSQIELEKANIKLKTFLKYCNTFGYSMDYVTNLTTSNDIKEINFIKEIDKKLISQRLKTFEKEQNIKGKNISKILGIQESTYSSYKSLKSKNIIQTLILKEISKNYGYSMDWFIGRSNTKYIKK